MAQVSWGRLTAGVSGWWDGGLVGWTLALVLERGLERKAPPQHASRFCSGADPGHQELSEAAVVESREPQPRPAATCCGPVSRPGSPLCSGARGLARASLLAPSWLLLRSSCFGRRSEGRVRPQRPQLLFAAARSGQTGHKAPRCRPRDSCLVRSTDLQGLASRLACPHRASVRPSAWGCPSLRVAGA